MRIAEYTEEMFELAYPLKMDGKEYTKIMLREVASSDEVELGRNKQARESIIFSVIFTIHRCVAEVIGATRLPTIEEIGYLPYAELERISVVLRTLTLGDEFQANGTCPHCNKVVAYDIKTDDFLVNQDIKFEDKTLELRRGAIRGTKMLKNAHIIPFSGWSLYELQKLTKEEFETSDATDYMATFIDKFDDKEATDDDIRDLTKYDRNLIRKEVTAPSIIKPTMEYECGECGKDIDLSVWVFDFLY